MDWGSVNANSLTGPLINRKSSHSAGRSIAPVANPFGLRDRRFLAWLKRNRRILDFELPLRDLAVPHGSPRLVLPLVIALTTTALRFSERNDHF